MPNGTSSTPPRAEALGPALVQPRCEGVDNREVGISRLPKYNATTRLRFPRGVSGVRQASINWDELLCVPSKIQIMA